MSSSFVPNDGKANKCTKCDKTVYPNEAIRAANGVYHKGCLKCTVCAITLNLKSVMAHESKPYCNTHVPKAGHTQVASVEMRSQQSAPKAAGKVQGVDKSERMTFAPGSRGGRGGAGGAPRGGAGGAPRGGAAGGAPRAAPAGGGYSGPNTVKVGGGGNKCPGCGKTVYTNEEIKACGSAWHKGCLKCTDCGITLNLKTLLSHQNKPYCAVHKPKVGHTQVASMEMRTALKAPKAARMQKGIDRTARGTFAPGALRPTSDAPIVNVGGVAGSDVQSQHAPKINFVAPEPTPHLEYDAPNEQFSNLSVGDSSYDQGGYDQGSYDQGGYDQGGYDDQGYDEGGYDQGGYDGGDQGGYDEGDQGGYDQGGYEEQGGYDEGDQGGYDQGGYDEGGYDEGGYDEGGYDEGGYDEGGYDEGGYDEGYDEGYYDEGY